MKQTRKFQAIRNAADVVGRSRSVADAAKTLGVERSTVHRWIHGGKVPKPGGSMAPVTPPAVVETVQAEAESKTPAQWAAWVRETYQPAETDRMLLDAAVFALMVQQDPKESTAMRLQAVTRFAAIVKQLNLQAVETPKVVQAPRPARVSGDPRAFLLAVK